MKNQNNNQFRIIKKTIFQIVFFLLIVGIFYTFFTFEAKAASVAQVVAGGNASCAIKENGNVYCWGYNSQGGLGDNTTTQRNTPVQVLKGAAASGDYDGDYLTNIKSISAGGGYNCAVSNSDNVYCWGYNSQGQLGDNTTTERHTPVQVLKGAAVSGDYSGDYLTNIKSIHAGSSHTCAVSNNDNVYCWGDNGFGALGDNTTTERHTPVQVLKGAAVSGDNDGTYLTNIKSTSGGYEYTCALSNSNNVYCWGANWSGGLGDNSTISKKTPVRVWKGAAASGDYDGDYLSNIKSISNGDMNACAVSNNNNVYCWGDDHFGELGDNSTIAKKTPVRVWKGEAASGDYDGDYLSNIKSIYNSQDYNACAVSNNDNVYCWGRNNFGQVGDDTTTQRNTPIRVLKGEAASGDNDGTYLTNIKSISAGSHICVLSNNNNAYCWGYNGQGGLGDNTTTHRHTPIRVLGVDGSGFLDLGFPPAISDPEEEEQSAEEAKITSWKASEYQKPNSSCQQWLKLEIEGKHFDKDAEVRIGNKEASSVNRKSGKELTAKFCLTKLLNVKKDSERTISVTNPHADTEKADKKIDLGNISLQLSADDLNMQTAEGIKNIQRSLVRLELLDQQYITGFYGPLTTEAVRKFQEQNGIEQIGIVGPLTKAKLEME